MKRKRPPVKDHPLWVRLTKEQRHDVDELALSQGLTASAYIRELVIEHLSEPVEK